MANHVIDLENYKDDQLFIGRFHGNRVREESNIDYIYSTYDEITIKIPNNTLAMNPAFFENLFKNVYPKLGEDKFFEKFKFDGDYDTTFDLAEAIYNIEREL